MKAKSRISLNNFTDAVLHHIFSFLEIKDIARLKAVSRRFQTLCISTPSFSFSHNRRHSPNCSCLHVFKFMKAIPRQRPLDLKINLLSFSSSCMKRKHRKLHIQWLRRLFQAFRVDQLSLNYKLPSIFQGLPIFQSLKVLILVMTEPCVSVKLPETKLSSLERLHIEGIETQDLVGEWVSQSFPSLKSLFLCDVDVPPVSTKQLDLIIQSSCLEDLTLKRCCGFKSVRILTNKLRALSYSNCTGRFCDNCDFELKKDDEIAVEVSAPNLRSFMWEGPPARLCYDKMTFKNLHIAAITGLVFHNLNLGEQLFEAIRGVKILSLDTLVLLQDLYGMAHISFGDVRHLEIQVGRSFIYNDVVTNFLKRISNLEILALASDDYYEEPDPFDFKDALMECTKTKWKKIKGLKKVKFTTRSMYFSMAFLIGMLKKSCVDMEEMTLIYPSCYHKSLEHYLNCLESGSSSLSINLSPPNLNLSPPNTTRKNVFSHGQNPLQIKENPLQTGSATEFATEKIL